MSWRRSASQSTPASLACRAARRVPEKASSPPSSYPSMKNPDREPSTHRPATGTAAAQREDRAPDQHRTRPAPDRIPLAPVPSKPAAQASAWAWQTWFERTWLGQTSLKLTWLEQERFERSSDWQASDRASKLDWLPPWLPYLTGTIVASLRGFF